MVFTFVKALIYTFSALTLAFASSDVKVSPAESKSFITSLVAAMNADSGSVALKSAMEAKKGTVKKSDSLINYAFDVLYCANEGQKEQVCALKWALGKFGNVFTETRDELFKHEFPLDKAIEEYVREHKGSIKEYTKDKGPLDGSNFAQAMQQLENYYKTKVQFDDDDKKRTQVASTTPEDYDKKGGLGGGDSTGGGGGSGDTKKGGGLGGGLDGGAVDDKRVALSEEMQKNLEPFERAKVEELDPVQLITRDQVIKLLLVMSPKEVKENAIRNLLCFWSLHPHMDDFYPADLGQKINSTNDWDKLTTNTGNKYQAIVQPLIDAKKLKPSDYHNIEKFVEHAKDPLQKLREEKIEEQRQLCLAAALKGRTDAKAIETDVEGFLQEFTADKKSHATLKKGAELLKRLVDGPSDLEKKKQVDLKKACIDHLDKVVDVPKKQVFAQQLADAQKTGICCIETPRLEKLSSELDLYIKGVESKDKKTKEDKDKKEKEDKEKRDKEAKEAKEAKEEQDKKDKEKKEKEEKEAKDKKLKEDEENDQKELAALKTQCQTAFKVLQDAKVDTKVLDGFTKQTNDLEALSDVKNAKLEFAKHLKALQDAAPKDPKDKSFARYAGMVLFVVLGSGGVAFVAYKLLLEKKESEDETISSDVVDDMV